LAAGQEVPVAVPTVGLCFNYQRGVTFDSVYLSDVGLETVLKTLARHNLKATFNCPAKVCELAPARVKMIADAGHEVAALGYADESCREMDDDALKQLIYTCRNAFAKLNLRPLGFGSPGSTGDERLCRELSKQRFRYSVEHDHAKQPYVVEPGPPPIIRMPVSTDDRGLLRSEGTVDKTIAKHYRRLRRAVEERHFVSVCFHPWILAEEKDRMQHWEEWLQTAIKLGARISPLKDVLPPEQPADEAAGQ
jgi:peptidoglycan/xylan/chitin deacetylase (PgdA/CDA1 family)